MRDRIKERRLKEWLLCREKDFIFRLDAVQNGLEGGPFGTTTRIEIQVILALATSARGPVRGTL